MVNKGLKTKGKNILEKADYTHPVYDVLYKKMKAALGGEVKFMLTGAAPISDEVKKFFKSVISCPLIELYG